ncbi:MAG TPA: S8 family peptidase, partial [Candidatus Krumholzibacteria bacterium]|nr:S8 family peptidase [Candidatus Krumholzibacteria bacterium]
MSNRYLRLGAFAVLFVAIASWALTAGGQQPQSYVPRQVIIKLEASTPTADALAVRSSLRASVKQRFKSSGAELWVIDGIEVNEAIARFKDDPRVDYIEPNYTVRALDVFPNDPRFDDLWGMHNTGQTGGTPDADIDAPEAWELGTGGGVLVGVIDTGVDYNHVDLAANMFINPNEIPGNGVDDDFNGYIDDVRGWDFVNNDNNPMDDHGHGTHVSGTIGALGNNGVGVVGVSWSVRIMGLKFLDAGGFGSTSDAILAVEYATMMGVKLTSNSWGGGGFSQALQDAIEAAGNAGILFVAAAGNASSNNDVFPNFPSNYPLDNIIAVASTDHRDNLSGFSNFGLTTVDLGAPGTDILSTFPNNTYGTISGTSMATPHV